MGNGIGCHTGHQEVTGVAPESKLSNMCPALKPGSQKSPEVKNRELVVLKRTNVLQTSLQKKIKAQRKYRIRCRLR